MKKIAFLLILLSFIGRVICSGQKIDQGAKINQLELQSENLTMEIEDLLVQNSLALSVTRMANSGGIYNELKLTQTNIANTSIIAQSQ